MRMVEPCARILDDAYASFSTNLKNHIAEDKNFHATWFYFIGNPHHINIIMNFRKIYFKAQKSPHLYKMMPKPMVQAHGTSFHFWPVIQTHESHLGNFGSRDLEGQEVCSIKPQRFKVDKRKYVAYHVFPNFLNSDKSVCNR